MSKFFHFLKFTFSANILKRFLGIFSFVITIFSFIIIFFPLKTESYDYRTLGAILFAIVIFIIFILTAIFYGTKKKITLKINQSRVIIRCCNILDQNNFPEKTYRVIGVNEYFDTHLGDGVIDETTLHGQYLQKYYTSDISDLDKRITNGISRSEIAVALDNKERAYNKVIKYRLGTTFLDKKTNIILVALTHFDDNNNAKIMTRDLMLCYSHMWDNLLKLKQANSIAIPLLGAGTTTQMNPVMSYQQILEALLMTFKFSNMQFKYPASLQIIISEKVIKEINLLEIKDRYSED